MSRWPLKKPIHISELVVSAVHFAPSTRRGAAAFAEAVELKKINTENTNKLQSRCFMAIKQVWPVK